eukprot:TRINITY_DN42132_c0_g1_i1.p1 TRINITY_DN42132_c0_g1~~TRINITY_DN42132_c0_g1_i1.p1  ORF type:complete len:676 (-),score=128.15 TRINITY_DN42132_c0_g1_i1:115-2142(-)
MASLFKFTGTPGKSSASTEREAGVQAVLRSQLVRDISSLREFEDDLDACELLGQGSYGSVHLITDKVSGNRRVLKTVVRPESWNADRLRMEGLIMKNLDHPHILRLFEWFENGDLAKLVCDFCEGGELLSTIRKGRGNGVSLEEPWAACALRQTFQALAYMHGKSVVHKDLKGENLLLLRSTASDDGKDFGKMPHVVVCDLGTAEICGRGLAHLFGSRGTRVAGTPATTSPEALNGNSSPKSDIWSMGCVMFEMLTNQLPFNLLGSMADAAKKQVVWLDLLKAGPKWDQLRCSKDANHLCHKLLQFREGNRPSALECLKVPWLTYGVEDTLTELQKKACRKAVSAWTKLDNCRRALCLKMAGTCTIIDQFANAYLKVDTDNSGMLERSEVLRFLDIIGYDRSDATYAADQLDVNNDGAIHYLEFSAMCLLSLDAEFDELLLQEFKALAKTREYITEMELAPLTMELSRIASGGSIGLKFDKLDLNRDGRVDFEEFGAYFGRPGIKYPADGNFASMTENDADKAPAAVPDASSLKMSDSGALTRGSLRLPAMGGKDDSGTRDAKSTSSPISAPGNFSDKKRSKAAAAKKPAKVEAARKMADVDKVAESRAPVSSEAVATTTSQEASARIAMSTQSQAKLGAQAQTPQRNEVSQSFEANDQIFPSQSKPVYHAIISV